MVLASIDIIVSVKNLLTETTIWIGANTANSRSFKDRFRYDNLLTWLIVFPSGFFYVKKPKRFVIFYSNEKFIMQPLTFFNKKNPEGKSIH